MITVEEARTKWCPFARYSDASREIQGANRFYRVRGGVEGETHLTCLGPDCMAWNAGHQAGTGECGLVPKRA